MSFESEQTGGLPTLPYRPWLRSLGIMLIFGIAGPILGLVVAVIILSTAMTFGSNASFIDAVRSFFESAALLGLFGGFFTYQIGLAPALAAGAFIAWHEGWRGPVTGFSAVLLGFGVGAIYYMVSEFSAAAPGGYGASFLIIVCTVSTYLLSRVVRFIGRRDLPPTDELKSE